jgi:hypothetical protein
MTRVELAPEAVPAAEAFTAITPELGRWVLSNPGRPYCTES